MDVQAWLNSTRVVIDEWIEADIKAMGVEPQSVEEAMRYSLLAGGKRLRPQLVMAAADYVGIVPGEVRLAALAVEYVHTYSLIHDDLPAMDDDDMRRGQLTSHKVFGEAMAILAGDALLTEAFRLMTECGSQFHSENVVRAVHRLAEAAGRRGLVRGQVKDLAAEHQSISVAELEEIHRNKTGALFEVSLAIPAVLVGDEASATKLTRFGHHFGLAFQMVDDILNVIGDSVTLGKATGTDAGLGKATYPRLIGLETSQRLVQEHVALAREIIAGTRSEVLVGLLDFAVQRTW